MPLPTPEQIRAANDAEALEKAADVLRRRYGLLVAGDLITPLENRAGAIRAEEAADDVEQAVVCDFCSGPMPAHARSWRATRDGAFCSDACARQASFDTRSDEPGPGYWEAGDL